MQVIQVMFLTNAKNCQRQKNKMSRNIAGIAGITGARGSSLAFPPAGNPHRVIFLGCNSPALATMGVTK